MNHTKNREQFFSSKHFSGTLSLGGFEYAVEVETPDLSHCQKEVWGDWGPMFDCQLEREQKIQLKYRSMRTGAELRYRIAPPELQVHSPARYAEREKFPMYIEVIDMAHGLRIRGYMNSQGEVVKTEARVIPCGVNIGRLLERECESVQPQVMAS